MASLDLRGALNFASGVRLLDARLQNFRLIQFEVGELLVDQNVDLANFCLIPPPLKKANQCRQKCNRYPRQIEPAARAHRSLTEPQGRRPLAVPKGRRQGLWWATALRTPPARQSSGPSRETVVGSGGGSRRPSARRR